MLPRLSRSDAVSLNSDSARKALAFAPGKIILAGEHFVVLGNPAISMAINMYSTVQVRPVRRSGIEFSVDIPLRFLARSKPIAHSPDLNGILQPLEIAAKATLNRITEHKQGLDVNVRCEIPVAAGLGSSAATTVAIISAVSKSHGVDLERREIFKLAFAPERFLHGKPSGVDQATCIYGGTLQFTRPFEVKPIRINRSPTLLLCDTGIHHETKTLVGSVVEKSRMHKEGFKEHLEQAREISTGVSKALRTGDENELGLLLSWNHELLRKIGVSHPKLDRLVSVAKRAGALGAKLTGAGGGGCIIAVCQNGAARKTIARKLRREGGIPYKISRDWRGVRVSSP